MANLGALKKMTTVEAGPQHKVPLLEDTGAGEYIDNFFVLIGHESNVNLPEARAKTFLLFAQFGVG